MIDVFPKEISGQDIKLVKLEPTIENAKIIFDIIVVNRDEFRPWLEWTDFVKNIVHIFIYFSYIISSGSTSTITRMFLFDIRLFVAFVQKAPNEQIL